MAVIGLDIGTTGVKSSVISKTGELLGVAYKEYDLINEKANQYELDLRIIEEYAFCVIRKSVERAAASEIHAICVTSFGESIVLNDKNNCVLDKSMIYMDCRGKEEVEALVNAFSKQEFIDTCALSPNEMYTAAKLFWIKRNKPNILEKTEKIRFVADHILSRLGGGFYTDFSLASRTMFFDVHKKQWCQKILDFMGIDIELLPEIVATGSKVGELSQEASEKIGGIKVGIPLIIGGHDQIANAVGAGLLEAGNAMNGIGTVDCLTVAFKKEQSSKLISSGIYPCVPYLDGEIYITYGHNFSGGSVLKWFRNTFASELEPESAYEQLNKEAPEEPTNLNIIAHFAGRGTPYVDVNAKACIDGLDLSSDRGTIFRGLLEAESLDMKLNIELLESYGITFDTIRTVGGGSKSDLWMQIRADIFEKDIISMHVQETGALGSAMFAMVYLGQYKTLAEARACLCKEKHHYKPMDESVNIYKQKFDVYKQLYESRLPKEEDR